MHASITKQQVYEFLKTIPLAVFGTVATIHSPHLATMFYVVDENLNFYFITRSQTTKVDNIKRGSHVSILVSDRYSYKTVEAYGTAIELTGVDKIKTIFKMFTDVYATQGVIEKGKLFNWPPPIQKLDRGEIAIYEIQPSWIRYADFSHASPLDEDFKQEIVI